MDSDIETLPIERPRFDPMRFFRGLATAMADTHLTKSDSTSIAPDELKEDTVSDHHG